MIKRKVPQKSHLFYETDDPDGIGKKIVPVVALIGGNAALDADGARVVISGPTSAFGEVIATKTVAYAQLKFTNGIVSQMMKSVVSGSGSITAANGMAQVTTGTTAGSIARLKSTRIVRYAPGQGVETRFSLLLDTGVAGTTQVVGIGDAENALGIGMNGTSVAILHRTGGQREIRELTVTAASTGAGTITITLNGGAGVPVAIAGALTIGEVAQEIADADYSTENGGWVAHYEGNAVSFMAVDTDTRNGAYTFGAGATGAAGTFAQAAAAVAATDTWINAADFNVDKGDGTGALPAIDPTKGQIGRIQFQWLGFGMISFFIEHPETGEFTGCHSIQYANANVLPSVAEPNMPLLIEANNGATSSSINVQAASLGAFAMGDLTFTGPTFTTGASATIGIVEAPILAIHANILSLTGSTSKIRVFVDEISFGTESAKVTTFKGYVNPTLTGAPTWAAVDAESVVSVSTDMTSFSGGTIALVDVIGGVGGHEHRPQRGLRDLILEPGDMLLITGQASGTPSVNMLANIVWIEDF